MNIIELTYLVNDYIRTHRQRIDRHLDYYRNLESFETVIKNAVSGKDNTAYMNPHQYRLDKEVILEQEKVFLSIKDELQKVTSFRELILTIEQYSVSGFGILAIYDTALRVGAYLNKYPEAVYLHAGTRKGAKALKLDVRFKTILPSKLPETLLVLKPYEVEAFLCIYKGKLSEIEG